MADAPPRDDETHSANEGRFGHGPETTAVGDEGGTAAPSSDVSAALAAAEAKATEHRNDYLRALAELDNVRKRAQRDIESAHRYGLERFAQELLAVKDSLEMGLAAGKQASAEGGDPAEAIKRLLEGSEATLQLLTRAFEKFNIREINPLGAVFDPQLHEAMTMQPSNTAEPDSVLQVVQKGYQLNERLLRPARVIVAKLPEETGGAA